MKKYESPKLETVYFEAEDVILTSPVTGGEVDTPDPGGDDF